VDLTEDRVTLKVSDNTRLVFERSSVNSVVTDEDASAEKEEKKKEEKKEQAKEESK
jgi:preprotein translocase subunit YajC